MNSASLAGRALRHERLLVAAGLLLVVILAWAYLWSGAGTLQEMGDMVMPMTGPWTAGQAVLMWVMWVVMMAAMMLPSAAPMILLYAKIAQRRMAGRGGGIAPATGLFACGYLAVWAAFSVIAVALQFALEKLAWLSPMMEASSRGLAGTVLLAAGIYQWTPLKQACLRQCRSPLDFVLTCWREGRAGAFSMGMHHGIYCVGCCWMLMLLLFVGGVMNLTWIAGLAALVLVEKLLPAGHWIARLTGLLLMAWGFTVLASIDFSLG